jgi:hypothetical protein
LHGLLLSFAIFISRRKIPVESRRGIHLHSGGGGFCFFAEELILRATPSNPLGSGKGFCLIGRA